MDERPVLLGMNNPISLDPDHALYPVPPQHAGGRLYAMLDGAAQPGEVSTTKYIREFDRRNLVLGLQWNMRQASETADALVPELHSRHVVMLGSSVIAAFQVPRHDWCVWSTQYGVRYCCVPHPSGRCREYNDPQMRARVGQMLLYLYRGERP